MTQLNPKKTALALGVFFGGVHVLWSALVALGVAQAVLDFIFWLHMIRAVYLVDTFNLVASLSLVLMTFVMGAVVGFIFAKIWNWLHR
ncbi:MAG: hypothetical protein Greene07147_612 [Parcubacteria group bacterium Greene0714_7]|nr:hypothetical protein [Candidatus Paceibacterota bacterium]MBP9832074.1 hypothetical protein [Candidatus Paceibacterota bacterium]TSD05291.1 MAG: hypothetical protein Greene07147_612 [Parcubacteria group bacterium Greene0714_7]